MLEHRKLSSDPIKPFKKAKINSPIMADLNKTRKIRVFCNDPYATDSSSDEDEPMESDKKLSRSKRFIREIILPLVVLPEPKHLEPESSSQDSSRSNKNPKKRVLAKTPTTTVRKPVGVRQRKWGKWAAEIRHPLTKCRIWLGTYNTLEEAVNAYESKKREFQAITAAAAAAASEKSRNMSSSVTASQSPSIDNNNTVSSEESESIVSHTSPFSVLELETSASTDVNGGSVGLVKEELGANFDSLPIPDFIDEPLGAGPVEELGFFPELDLAIDEYGRFEDDYCVIDDFCLQGLECDVPSNLPDYDFDIGNEDFAFADEQFPINIACQ